MGEKLIKKIDSWKKKLLDFSKVNKLINIRETKRSHVKITSPDLEELYRSLVIDEKILKFQYTKNILFGEDEIKGDFKTGRTDADLQKTLKSIRAKAKLISEEQGVNTLFVTFGTLIWQEVAASDISFTSPLILVPVKLQIESLGSPYTLSLGEDEIVVNPTLAHKLETDFGIKLPAFEGENIKGFLEEVVELVKNSGWEVDKDVFLGILSFRKINMYNDLVKNPDKIDDCQVLRAIAGEETISYDNLGELNNYDHDNSTRPIDVFQVVDADSSQQDAILLSKKGISFVLQGPPGTGKSQTITNIISEALADGKKVLFVSEKMAALQVVYNRLVDSGLGDFCFTLHNHKAKKKDILNDLSACLNVDRRRVAQQTIDHLDVLKRDRDNLISYRNQLHTPFSELHKTVFQVNGELAKLESVPDISFNIPDVDKIGKEEFFKRESALQELSQTFEKKTSDYEENVWRGSKVQTLTNKLRHDIDSNVALILPLMSELQKEFERIVKQLGINLPCTLNGINNLILVLEIAKESPCFVSNWYNLDIDALIKTCEEYKGICSSYRDIKETLGKIFNEKFFSVKAIVFFNELNYLWQNINDKTSLNGQQIEDVRSFWGQIVDIYNDIEQIRDFSVWFANFLQPIQGEFKFGDMSFCVNVARLLYECEIIPDSWCNDDVFSNIKGTIDSAEILHDKTTAKRQLILEQCDEEILKVDLYPLLKKFRAQYTSSLKRLFSSEYKNDLRTIQQYFKDGKKLNYPEALAFLNLLKEYQDGERKVNEQYDSFVELFGNLYGKYSTDWQAIRVAANNFQCLSNGFQNHVLPDQFKESIKVGKISFDKIKTFFYTYNVESVDKQIHDLNMISRANYEKSSVVNSALEFISETISLCEKISCYYDTLISYRNVSCPITCLVEELRELVEYQKLENIIQKDSQLLEEYFEEYFDSYNTDWDSIKNALEYVKKLKAFEHADVLSDEFVGYIANDTEKISFCEEQWELLESLFRRLAAPFGSFIHLFEIETVYGFADISCNILKNKIVLCRDNKNQLEEWVDYQSARKKCAQFGMTEFVDKVISSNVKPEQIVDTYKKRFYKLWLDKALEEFPAVRDFRTRKHEETIKEFAQKDVLQFKIAQARVKERLYKAMPNIDSFSSTAQDETSILRRELSKSRKFMPLRRLFKAIPNVLKDLKPCFMMSPLSVSVYLEAKSYMFDLVIFDEASQVHTEDAVGAIMRGQQVIIVGDQKQLPPTSFFSATIDSENDDFDSEEEVVVDNDCYESILEEAASVLPDRYLRWHYRSRHEDLITFSNIKIYNNQLITFPSIEGRKEDTGVEYVYVRDGVYDRGKRRDNVAEARKVADLIFEHFKKHPKKSLGVIAFSEAQQQAIENAVYEKRRNYPSFEKFFNEGNEEPFFIKNLETVQGDERDNIIFSIGYAKDKQGKMSMNFGPLNGAGGERRLNVAITRAKYNVKLVGSIQPSDINVDNVSSAGVKLLRSYIEFAQQGVAAIQQEITLSDNEYFDSPFEESVYDFLSERGYDVATQVGCSNFRIDLAVKHPSDKGRFVIGIECDGASYHSSRTARERDRLRQAILESMGWKIYRIWSTDWIKAMNQEKEKLVQAIEEAIKTPKTQPAPIRQEPENAAESEITLEPIEEELVNETSLNHYGFKPYERADVSKIMDNRDNSLFGYSKSYIIRKVIKLEQPIHFKELCDRVVQPLYGQRRVTPKITDDVQSEIRNYLRNEITQEGDFIMMRDIPEVVVRVPKDGDEYVRTIDHISDREIRAAMMAIIEKSYGITKEQLIITTAREFGFNRTGSSISGALGSVYHKMLKNRDIKEIEEKPEIIRH